MSDDEQAGSTDVPGEALFELAELPLIVEIDPMAPTSGRCWVTTEMATYLVDLDDEFIVRTSNDGPRSGPGDGSYWASRLRMDSKRIPLARLCVMRVSEPMLLGLELEIRRDGIPTGRPTTLVK